MKIKTSVFLHFVFEISVFNCQGAEFWIFVFEKCSYKKKSAKIELLFFLIYEISEMRTKLKIPVPQNCDQLF